MIIKISLLIIGAIIGAGFISGSEILLFFYSFGIYGWIGMVISVGIISSIIYKTLNIISKNKIYNYDNFINNIFVINEKNNYILFLMSILVKSFLLISFYIMIAGVGTYFFQEFKINKYIGIIISAIFCCFMLSKNVDKIIELNKYLIPFIIITILLFGIISFGNMSSISSINLEFNIKSIIYAILYGSYNCIPIIPLLINLKKYQLNNSDNKKISLIVFIFLLIISNIIFLSLNKINYKETKIEMPTVYLASKYGSIFKTLFDASVLIAIFTTAISSGYSFVNSFKKKNKIICAIFISSLIICPLGFGGLINIMYPLFGILGIFQIIIILLHKA